MIDLRKQKLYSLCVPVKFRLYDTAMGIWSLANREKYSLKKTMKGLCEEQVFAYQTWPKEDMLLVHPTNKVKLSSSNLYLQAYARTKTLGWL